MAHSQVASRIRQVNTVAVPVSDPDRAIEFYVGMLGLEKRRDMPFGQGSRWVEVAPEGAATTIVLAAPGQNKTGVDTGIRLATDNCEAQHRDLRNRGVSVDEIMNWPGVPPMFTLRDPDGNTLYIVEG